MTDVTAAQSIFRRWIHDVWAGKPIADDLVADDFVGHWPGRDVRGRDELAAIIAQTHGMFRGLTFDIELGPITDGDLMAGRWTGVGAHDSGEARFSGNDILRIADGRIVEYWTGTSTG